ncbi:hypothetical protein NL676_038461 [Syzygium grande]|nr:hypothetical protein NL676_038461 [Syzygium grande]
MPPSQPRAAPATLRRQPWGEDALPTRQRPPCGGHVSRLILSFLPLAFTPVMFLLRWDHHNTAIEATTAKVAALKMQQP